MMALRPGTQFVNFQKVLAIFFSGYSVLNSAVKLVEGAVIYPRNN